MGKRDTIPGIFDQILNRFGRLDILVKQRRRHLGSAPRGHPLEAWDSSSP